MDEMTAQLSGVNLGALTGRPVAGDILLYALPVCGPYEALKVLISTIVPLLIMY